MKIVILPGKDTLIISDTAPLTWNGAFNEGVAAVYSQAKEIDIDRLVAEWLINETIEIRHVAQKGVILKSKRGMKFSDYIKSQTESVREKK